jgi:hypothetical protein
MNGLISAGNINLHGPVSRHQMFVIVQVIMALIWPRNITLQSKVFNIIATTIQPRQNCIFNDSDVEVEAVEWANTYGCVIKLVIG